MEQWKAVLGYEGIYEVSDWGAVRGLDRIVKGRTGMPKNQRGKILRQVNASGGYKSVHLSKDGVATLLTVHRLVAKAFIRLPVGNEQVNHKDGRRQNNIISNLEWCTPSENIKHSFASNGRKPSWKGKPVVEVDKGGVLVRHFDTYV
jgi:hypothetical protein